MLYNKNQQIKDIYLDDGFPVLHLDTVNEARFLKAHQNFNIDLSQKYSIDPKIKELERKIEEEFQDRKSIQAKIYAKLEEERNFQTRSNEFFRKKSHITPPYYHLQNEKSPPRDRDHSLSIKNENQSNIDNKSTQTLNHQFPHIFFNEIVPSKKNPDFNVNKKERIDTKTKFFNSEGKKSKGFFANSSPENNKMRTSTKFCMACEPKFSSPERNNPPLYNELNKILLEAKSLIIKRKIKEANKLLEDLIKKDIKHADVFYLMGETKRLSGEFESSEEMLLKSLSFEMHSPFCYYSLALVFMEQKKYDRAINLWKIFLKLKGNNVSGFFELAKCFLETEAYVEAASCLNKAIDLDNKIPDLFLLRAEAFELLNLEESAKNDYKKYKLLSPKFQEKYEIEIKRLEGFGLFEEGLKLKKFVEKIKNL